MKIHPSLTEDRVCSAVANQMNSLENPGFCIKCGWEQDGCEPDAREYKCTNCDSNTVYGAEELLLHLVS